MYGRSRPSLKPIVEPRVSLTFGEDVDADADVDADVDVDVDAVDGLFDANENERNEIKLN